LKLKENQLAPVKNVCTHITGCHTACESYLSFGSAYGATSFVSYVIEDFDAKPW
jgi:hypothetical protein